MKRLVAIGMVVAAGVSACVDDSPSADLDFTIEVFGPYEGAEADRFGAVLDGFEITTGVPVRYVGSSDFVVDLLDRAGDPRHTPDIAVIPQIGTVEQLAVEQHILPLSDDVRATMVDLYGENTAALGEVDETAYAVPFRLTIKSLVWYRPALFEAKGWSPPATLDELRMLVERIRVDDETMPWCFGNRSGGQSGWASTDWTEDLVLRLAGIDLYERWAAGEVKFSAPGVERSFEEFSSLVLRGDRAVGGLDGILDTDVDQAVLPLFDEPGGCAMYKQADFAVGWMPSGTEIGPEGDVDFFVLPGLEAGEPQPILIGGDNVVQFTDGVNVDRLMAYLATPGAAAIWARHGGFISPNAGVADDVYPDDYLVEITAALAEAEVLAYDASDQMPPTFGSDELWELVTDWVSGALDYETFAERADAGLAEALTTLDAARDTAAAEAAD